MNYEKNYNDYLNYVKTLNRYKKDGNYYEKHHIIPKSLGGSNDESNLVLLTAREHFLAHYLLCKMTEGKEEHYKMVCAFNLMLSFSKKSTLQLEERTNAFYKNSRFYALVKKKYAAELSSFRKGKSFCHKKKKEKRYWIFNRNSSKDKMVLLEELPFYLNNGWERGRLNKKAPVYSKKIKKTRMYNPSANLEKNIPPEMVSEYLENGWIIGSRPVSEETRKKHREAMLDPNGKYQLYFSKLRSGELKRNHFSGTKRLNKEGKYITVKLEEVDNYLKNGWKIGGKPKSEEWKKKMSIAMKGNKNGSKTKGDKK